MTVNSDPLARAFRYVVTAPILSNGWVLLGDTSKFFVATSDRFSNMDFGGKDLAVTISGASKERVMVQLLAPHAVELAEMDMSPIQTVKTECVLSTAGRAQLRCTGGQCFCSDS